MRGFLRACSAETLKLKRALALWVAVLAPLLIVLLQSMYVLRVRKLRGDLWQNLMQGTMGWSILVLPLTAALLTALVNGIEHREGNWKKLYALPLPRWAVYGAKVTAAQLLLALSHGTLWCAMIAAGMLLHAALPQLAYGPVPLLPLLRRVALMHVAAGAMIAIHVWVSARAKSFTVPLGLGIAVVAVSLAAARDSAMTFWPWMFAANASSPERWVWALSLGAAGGIVVSALGAWDTGRRDVL